MFTKRIAVVAFKMGPCMTRSLKTPATSNNYRRWYKEKIKQMRPFPSINPSYKKKVTDHCKKIFSRSMAAYCATTEKEKASETTEDTLSPEQKEIKSLEEANLQLKDKYNRALADRENTRKRLQKEIGDAKIFGIQSFCKDLLEVSDIFKKALENVPEGAIEKADKDIKNLYDGIVMTESQLHIVFDRHGLQQIIPEEGQKFDPSFQEAMMKVAAEDDQQTNTIASVFRTGWKLRDRCIRSAQVSVYKKS